jgi:hypothetical protein
MWAAIIYGVMCATAKAFDDVTIAGIYAVDRNLCRLYVDQDTINRHLANVVVQYDISPSQAIIAAAEIGTVLEGNVRQSGRIAEYCVGRTKR